MIHTHVLANDHDFPRFYREPRSTIEGQVWAARNRGTNAIFARLIAWRMNFAEKRIAERSDGGRTRKR